MLQQIYRLRVRAWRARTTDFADQWDSWSDAHDLTSHHFAILLDQMPVAAGRLTIARDTTEAPDPETYRQLNPREAVPPIAFISRLVVCPEHAGRGLSELIDHHRIAFAKKANCKTILVGAAGKRIAKLETLGFRALYVASLQTRGPLEGVVAPTILALSLGGVRQPLVAKRVEAAR
jgi:GNAT superfamily N-acetyltransferase